MKHTIFKGAASAIITPFTKDGIDYDTFGRLLDWQITEGIDAVVVAGTTGESATITDDEFKQLTEFSVKKINKRIPLIMGTGSNNTAHAIEKSKLAEKLGADALLLVTPYYNKATQQGLIEHYNAIAKETKLPIILYNVPSRTGVNILPQTVFELSKTDNIVAIKEASGNISQIAQVCSLCKDTIDVYSGNDDQIIPIMSLGGLGGISVLSNILPKETSKMCHLFLDGKIEEAANEQLKYIKLINSLFSEVNPIPVKSAMSHIGFGENYVRLPLTKMNKELEEKMLQNMRDVGMKF